MASHQQKITLVKDKVQKNSFIWRFGFFIFLLFLVIASIFNGYRVGHHIWQVGVRQKIP